MLKQTMAIFATPNPKEELGFSFTLIPKDKKWFMRDEDICVGETEVVYPPPSDMTREEMVAHAIETLQDRQKQAMANAQLKFNELQTKIEKLQLITYQPEHPNMEGKVDIILEAEDDVIPF